MGARDRVGRGFARGDDIMNLGIWLFIAAILIVVMVHESGHFFMAKLFNFKATKFFLGFGPTLWSTTKGETEYGVKAIPAGGFVKIVGMNPYEEVPPEDVPRSYPNKPKWQRALVLVAGSATHWVVAFVLLMVATMTIGFPTGEVTNELAVVQSEVFGNPTPAGEIDLQPGESIVAVGGVEDHQGGGVDDHSHEGGVTEDWNFIRNYIRANGGEQTTFLIENLEGRVRIARVRLGWIVYGHDGVPIDYVRPGEGPPELETGQTTAGFLGVEPELEYQTEGLVGSIENAGYWTWDVTKASVRGIGEVFSMPFSGELWSALSGEGERELDEGPIGLVGASRFAGETIDRGRYLDLVGLIVGFTIFVGLMNLLPLPPLDGGHLAVLAYETVTGRSVDVRKLIPVAAAVISFFALLFIAVLYLDLARPIRTPF